MSVNFVFIYGESVNRNKDKMLRNLPPTWNIHVIKFFPGPIDLPSHIKQVYAFDDPVFSQELSGDERHDLESWLGTSFHLALQYNVHMYSGYRVMRKKKLDKYYLMMAKYTKFYRKYFQENKFHVFSMFTGSRLPFVPAALAAKRLGIKPMIYGDGGMTNSIFIYDYDFNPVFWKEITSDDIKNAKSFFLTRYSKKDKQPEGHGVFKESKHELGFLHTLQKNLKRIPGRFFSDKRFLIHPKPVLVDVMDKLSIQVRKILVPFFLEKPTYSKKFFFFPIHFDVETNLTWREHFIYQWDLIRKVAECLPLDVELYVKPHPNWHCAEVVFGELLKLKKWDNIRFLDQKTSPFDLINMSEGVITISSTTGLEAIVLGKPVITFGHTYYSQKRNTLQVFDLKNLSDCIQLALSKPSETFDQTDRDLLLANYFKHVIIIEQFSLFLSEHSDNDGKKIASEMAKYGEFLKTSKKFPNYD